MPKAVAGQVPWCQLDGVRSSKENLLGKAKLAPGKATQASHERVRRWRVKKQKEKENKYTDGGEATKQKTKIKNNKVGFIDSVRVRLEGMTERAVFLAGCDVGLWSGDFLDGQLSCRRPQCHPGRVVLCLPWHLVPLSSFIISVFFTFYRLVQIFFKPHACFPGLQPALGASGHSSGREWACEDPAAPPALGRAAVSVLLARLGEGLVRQVLVMSPAPSPTSPGVCNRGQKSRKETQHQLFPAVRRGGQQRVQGPRVRGRHPPLLTRGVQHQEPALFLHPPPSVSVSVSEEGRERGS